MASTTSLSAADAQTLRTFAAALLAALDAKEAPTILRALDAAVLSPPTTTEEVGFYVGRTHNAFENCFRFFVSRLSQTPHVMQAEDKMSLDILAELERFIALPPSARALFPFSFDADAFADDSGPGAQEAMVRRLAEGYLAFTQDVEKAFVANGKRLLSLWTVPGDTSYFVAVPEAFADAWANVVVGRTSSHEPMGVRSPAWATYYGFLTYTFMLPDHALPNGVEDPAWREA